MSGGHTAGPWAIHPEETGCEVFGGDSATLMHFCRPPYELAANARLIAAAPELLASLVEVMDWLDSPDELSLNGEQVERIRAAIAKAHGGQP